MDHEWAEILMKDHQVHEQVFEVGRKELGKESPSAVILRGVVEYLTDYLDGCHNRKEEENLFPLLERRGIPRSGGPLAVMLNEHAQSKQMLAELRPLFDDVIGGNQAQLAELRAKFDAYATLLAGHFWKENDILYPMARRVMSADDQATVLSGIEATEAQLSPGARAKYYAKADELARGGVEDLSFGLSRDELAAILNTLPVELSFVDADDNVRYFSHEQHKKIFPRNRGVIGLKVQNCHPSKSVHLVNQILADFKAGKRDVAEFWIEMGDRKPYIRYFPVRSADGSYLGCLEVVQDIAPVQALQGQKRLLDEG
jgi:hypothetical protein